MNDSIHGLLVTVNSNHLGVSELYSHFMKINVSVVRDDAI